MVPGATYVTPLVGLCSGITSFEERYRLMNKLSPSGRNVWRSLAHVVNPRALLLTFTTSMALSTKTGNCRAKKMTLLSEWLRVEDGEHRGGVIRGFCHRSWTESYLVLSDDLYEQPTR